MGIVPSSNLRKKERETGNGLSGNNAARGYCVCKQPASFMKNAGGVDMILAPVFFLSEGTDIHLVLSFYIINAAFTYIAAFKRRDMIEFIPA